MDCLIIDKSLIIQKQKPNATAILIGSSLTVATDFSLWRGTKKLQESCTHILQIHKPNGNWVVDHMANVFTRFLVKYWQRKKTTSMKLLKNYLYKEIDSTNQEINPSTAPSYDLITGRILQQLSLKVSTVSLKKSSKYAGCPGTAVGKILLVFLSASNHIRSSLHMQSSRILVYEPRHLISSFVAFIAFVLSAAVLRVCNVCRRTGTPF